MTENTRIIDLTVGQLKDIIQFIVSGQIDEALAHKRVENSHTTLAHGISGLAKIIGTSTRYAQYLKSKGVFDSAITQVGRTITIDSEKAITAWKLYEQRTHNA